LESVDGRGFLCTKFNGWDLSITFFDSDSIRKGVKKITMACEKRPSHYVGVCRNEVYERNATLGTHFFITITAYKE
jgi:hypothetical protein